MAAPTSLPFVANPDPDSDSIQTLYYKQALFTVLSQLLVHYQNLSADFPSAETLLDSIKFLQYFSFNNNSQEFGTNISS